MRAAGLVDGRTAGRISWHGWQPIERIAWYCRRPARLAVGRGCRLGNLARLTACRFGCRSSSLARLRACRGCRMGGLARLARLAV